MRSQFHSQWKIVERNRFSPVDRNWFSQMIEQWDYTAMQHFRSYSSIMSTCFFRAHSTHRHQWLGIRFMWHTSPVGWPQLWQYNLGSWFVPAALKPFPCKKVSEICLVTFSQSYQNRWDPVKHWSSVGGGRETATKTETESSYYGNISNIAMGTGAPEHALSRIEL